MVAAAVEPRSPPAAAAYFVTMSAATDSTRSDKATGFFIGDLRWGQDRTNDWTQIVKRLHTAKNSSLRDAPGDHRFPDLLGRCHRSGLRWMDTVRGEGAVVALPRLALVHPGAANVRR